MGRQHGYALPGVGLDLLDESWPIYARSVNAPPAFLGRRCQISHSAFNRGSDLEGTVENSVLAPNVTVGEGARVSYSVLFPGVTVEPGRRGGIRYPGRGLAASAATAAWAARRRRRRRIPGA